MGQHRGCIVHSTVKYSLNRQHWQKKVTPDGICQMSGERGFVLSDEHSPAASCKFCVGLRADALIQPQTHRHCAVVTKGLGCLFFNLFGVYLSTDYTTPSRSLQR